MFTGRLRLDRHASPPWSYRGEIALPSGRTAILEASVQEDAAGRFFAIRGGLQPGMTSAELESALTEKHAHHGLPPGIPLDDKPRREAWELI